MLWNYLGPSALGMGASGRRNALALMGQGMVGKRHSPRGYNVKKQLMTFKEGWSVKVKEGHL